MVETLHDEQKMSFGVEFAVSMLWPVQENGYATNYIIQVYLIFIGSGTSQMRAVPRRPFGKVELVNFLYICTNL